MPVQENDSRRSVRLWIAVAFGVALAAVAAMGFVTYEELKHLRNLATEVSGPNDYRDDLEGLHDSWAKADHSVRSYVLTWEGRDLTQYLQHIVAYDPLKQQFLQTSNKFQVKFKQEIADYQLAREVDSATQALVNLMDEREELHTNIIQQIHNYEVINVLSKVSGLQRVPTDDEFAQLLESMIKADGRKYLQPARRHNLASDSIDWSSDSESKELPSLDAQYQSIRRFYREDGPLHMEMYRLMARLSAINQKIRSVSSEKVRDEAKEGNVMIGVLAALILAVMGVFLARIFSDLERNAQLERELQAQKDLAESLAQAKEEFLANMSHEMRTPLGAIIGYSDQIAKTPLSPLQARLLKPVQHSADLLLNLINDILDFSKLESGNFTLERIPFQPRQVVEEVLEMFALMAAEKGISLRKEVGSEVPDWVLGDRIRFKQMLLNLVSNGIKFTPRGYVQVSLEPVAGQKDLLILAVEDTGIGIKKEKQAFIFEEFQQEDSSTNRRFGGTGLGLAITKKLTELQGGSVKLDSEPGKGTKVMLTLPLSSTHEADESNGIGANSSINLKWQGEKVLLADDVQVNRELVAYILKAWGLSVDQVADGKAALEAIKVSAYDLVLLDVHMPEMDGLEVAERSRMELKLTIPILALTATSAPEKIKEMKNRGFDGVLLKPFKEAQLKQEIHSVLPASHQEIISTKQPESMGSFSQLHQMSGGDKGMVLHMLKQYLESSGPQLATLKNQVAEQNWPQVAISAHRLVPSARILELGDIVMHAKWIEETADSSENLDQIPQRLEKLEVAISQAHIEVEQAIQDLGEP